MDWLTRKLGRAIEAAEVRDILERLSFGVSEPEPRVFSVTVPSWRATKDVSIKDDLVEEVGRMIGYDSIAPQPPLLPVTVPPSDPERLFERGVRSMVAAQGFTEVYNYSFLSEDQVRELGFHPADHLAVKNPIAADQSLMRRSLVPGVFKNLRENSRHLDCFRLFEIGREVHPETRGADGLPKEIPHLAAAMYSREEGEGNLFELKRVAECLMPGVGVRPAEARPFEHPARSAEVVWRDRALGRLFELHPSLLAGRGVILDLDLELMLELQTREKRYRPIRRYPSSAFDLSVVAGVRELVGDLRKRIASLAGEPLDSIEFLRRYSGPPIPEGMQSVSFRLTVAAPDRTLSLEEAGAIRSRIIEGMRERGYELRV
jgi:phenylalanyl-tRNA synthetase beta chain